MRTLILFLLFIAVADAGEPVPITIVVVDDVGQPIAQAEPAFDWFIVGPNMERKTNGPNDETFTDADGKATLKVEEWQFRYPLLVLSKDRLRGAFQTLTPTDVGKTITITLGPTARLKGSHYCKELKFKPIWMNTQVRPQNEKLSSIEQISKEASFDLILPVGKYHLSMYGEDVIQIERDVELTTLQSEFDLGVIDFKPSVIAKLKGKPAPKWTITEARGVPDSVQLSDYKGKWVYLEFWGFW